MFSIFTKTNYTNNPQLALFLFKTLSVSTKTLSSKEEKIINNILSQFNSRQDILNKAIEICGEPITPQQRYIYAIVYSWSNKEYRKKAIYYLNLYLNNELYEDIYIHRFSYLGQTDENKKIEHLTTMYNYLGEVYEKEYEFENALDIYNKVISINPFSPVGYRGKVNILIKQNNLDMAIKFLEDFKTSKYYSKNKINPNIENWLVQIIDEMLEDCQIKKESNYCYKPRKQKIDYVI